MLCFVRLVIRTEGMEKRRRGERGEEEKEEKKKRRGFCVSWGHPGDQNTPSPCLEARLYLSLLCKMRNGETEVKVESCEENFCLFSLVMVQHNRIHVGMCSLALPGLSWPSISCSLTTKSQLMSSFRAMQTIQTLANGVLGRKEEQPPQNSWVGHTLNIDANSTFRY